MTSVTEYENSPNRTLCLECNNQQMADYVGLDVQVPQFSPMVAVFVERGHLFRLPFYANLNFYIVGL